MEFPPPSPLPEPLHAAVAAEMDLHLPIADDDSSTALWDLGDLLDFAADDQFSLSLEQDNLPSVSSHHHLEIQSEAVPPSNSDRIRKRDPRLTCSNFLAGRVPCACPEMDALLEEEAATVPGKKRARTTRVAAGTVRCQVPGCEIDISELKGYHRRHRVCLRCATATAVVLDGETKRYCQQCGKFHILSDFDEGKRSCRRKLERHNNRRRRKPVDSTAAMESDRSGVHLEDVSCDGDVIGKDNIFFNHQTDQKEVVHLDSEDGLVTSTVCSAPDLQNNMDSGLTSVAMGEAQVDGGKDNSKSLASSYCDNKSTYSSMCPTGRISFKLYDWNPAEFPRRLRLQIFEWLANMPVELEGYIRPGCIILTAFVAMPKFMWIKLLEDPTAHVHNFVVARGRPLWGRGNMLVYLNNMIFRAVEGGSVMKIEVDIQAPRLHYVHPTCFEAGKPMEFVACGSHLQQPKFRSLVSFAGKYLAHSHSFVLPDCQKEGDTKYGDHQLFKIYIPHTEYDLFGPVFVEVENQSGLSNFIPILIGDSETCSEMKTIQERLDMSLLMEATGSSHESCEHSSYRQKVYSELMMDISWLLKKPSSEPLQHIMNSSQILRFTRLLNFLICNESTVILGRVLEHLKILMENVESNVAVNGFSYPDLRFFEKYLDYARDVLQLNLCKTGSSELHLGYLKPKGDRVSQSCAKNKLVSLSVVPGTGLKRESREGGHYQAVAGSTAIGNAETVPLLNAKLREKMMVQEHSRKSCSLLFSGALFRRRITLFAVTFVAVCFGVCAALVHSHKVGEFAVSIRRCLIDKL